MTRKNTVGHLKETSGQLEIEWEIADFLSLTSEAGAVLQSPVCFLSDSSWYLQVNVTTADEKKNSDNDPADYLGIFLIRNDSGVPKLVTFSFFLKMSTGRQIVIRDGRNTFDVKNQGWGTGKKLTRCKLVEHKSEFIPSGTLTIICSMKCETKGVLRAEEMLKEVMKDFIDSANVETQTEAYTGTAMLLGDIKGLITSGDLSDVVVKVQEEEFKLHRSILGARAPAFSATLNHDELKEKTTDIVSVDDFEVGAFRAFIHYLYTGRTDLLSSENALSLFKMAGKYSMHHLREACLEIIKQTPISVDTFVDIIEFSLEHEVKELFEQATDFLSENMAEVMVTEKWQTFLETNLKQANELLVQAAIRKNERIQP